MRRTWIGAAAAAGLSAASATGFAIAQQQPRQDQAPAGQQMERNHRAEGAEQGQRAQSAQALSPGEERQRNERATQEKTGLQKAGEQPGKAASEESKPAPGAEPGKAASAEGKAAQGVEPGKAASEEGKSTQAEERAKQAQTEKMSGEKRAGEENKAKAQGAQNNPENQPANRAAETEKSKAERTNQATGNEGPTKENGKAAAAQQTPANGASQAETNRPGAQNERQAEGQNPRGAQHVDPQKVRVEGNAHLSNDKAAQIADNLIGNARPQNINVNVRVGAALPGDVELAPLPPAIVSLVPEYRDYDYVVANDEIVIVQPSTRNVVEVIDTGGGVAMNESGPQAMAGGTRLNPCGP